MDVAWGVNSHGNDGPELIKELILDQDLPHLLGKLCINAIIEESSHRVRNLGVDDDR